MNEELLETYATLRRRISVTATAVLKETGLGLRQFIILRSLAEKGELTVSEMVELCMTDAGTVSRSIAQLREAKLIEKHQSKDDGRVWIIRLTPKGQAQVPKIHQIYSDLSQRCFGHLSPQDKSTLNLLLKKVADRLTAYP